MTKKLFFATLAAITLTVGFTSCSDDADEKKNEEENQSSGLLYDYFSDVKYNGETVCMISDAAYSEIARSFCTNVVNEVTDNTRLLIVDADVNADKYEDAIQKVYENGGTVGIFRPSSKQLYALFEKHPDWNGYWGDDDLNACLIYSFNSDGDHHMILPPDCDRVFMDYNDAEDVKIMQNDSVYNYQVTETDTLLGTSEENSQDANMPVMFHNGTDDDPTYGAFEAWFNHLKQIQSYGSETRRAVTRATTEGTLDVKSLLLSENYSKSYPFTAHSGNVRHVHAFTYPDVVTGSGSITSSLSIYKLHAYEGQSTSSGDYYMVNANTSIANGNMYHGRWWNYHFFTFLCIFVRMNGFACEEFGFEYEPLNDAVYIPATGSVMPKTTIGQTEYTTTQSFGVNVSATAGKGKSANKGHEWNTGISVGLSWSWVDTQKRALMDADIMNMTKDNKVGHKVKFNNLPYYSYWEDYGFKEPEAVAYRSTYDLASSWVWIDPTAKDDSDAPGISICFKTQPVYRIESFKTTAADLNTKRYYNFGVVNDTIKIKPFDRDRAFILNINNNSENSISHLKLYDENNEIIASDDNSYTKGKEFKFGAFKMKNKYYMTLQMNKKLYRYNLNDYIPMRNGEITTINVADDFGEVAEN